MEKHPPSPADSIRLIDDAIRNAQSNKTGAAYYYRLWGSVLFIYFIIGYLFTGSDIALLSKLNAFRWVFFPIGAFLSILRQRRDELKETVVPRFEKVYLFAFTGFAMAYGILFFDSIALESTVSLALFPLLLGVCVYVVGGITGHVPSIVGGILGVIGTGISLYLGPQEQLLVAAIASMVSCAVPGFMMRNAHV